MKHLRLPGRAGFANRRRLINLVLLIVGLGLLGYGLAGHWRRHRATHNPQPLPAPQHTVTSSTTMADETPIKPRADYRVVADQPRQIILPSINAQGFIQKVGIDQHGAMATPTSIAMAGWFAPGPRPGDPGVSVIDGHVQGRYQPGIFKNLTKLQPGDQFNIEFGDYSTKQFRVVSVHNYTPADLSPRIFAPVVGLGHQLNLITCSGRYDPKSRQYERRILVVSRLI